MKEKLSVIALIVSLITIGLVLSNPLDIIIGGLERTVSYTTGAITSASTTATSAGVVALAKDITRNYGAICNQAGVTAYIQGSSTSTPPAGYLLVANDCWEMNLENPHSGPFYVITASGTSTISSISW